MMRKSCQNRPTSQRRFAPRRSIPAPADRTRTPRTNHRFTVGAIAMSAWGWMRLRRLFRIVFSWESTLRARLPRRRKTIPNFESLEAMALLSTGSHMMGRYAEHLAHSRDHRLVSHVTKPHVVSTDDMSSDQTPVTSPAQTVSIGSTPTSFTNEPLAPVLNLFNPSLGTLLSVTVTHSATIESNVTSQNLSPSSATVITATFSGSYQIDGLNEPIAQPTQTLTSQPMPAGPFGSKCRQIRSRSLPSS